VWITSIPTVRARRQRRGAGPNRRLQQAHVVAQRLAESPRLEEVSLHVNDDERSSPDLETNRPRLRLEGLAHAPSFRLGSRRDAAEDV